MHDYDILLVNPPMVYLKDRLAQFGNMHQTEGASYRTFNPGLLSIGTYLDWKGYKVRVVDLLDRDVHDIVSILHQVKPLVVGISCSYGLTYLPTLAIARLIKQAAPDVLVATGGQHIGLLGPEALDDCEALDVVVKFEGEIPTRQLIEHQKGHQPLDAIDGIVYRLRSETQPGKSQPYLDKGRHAETVDLNEMPFLKYELYDDYLSYPPYVEESRGCAWACEFCAAVTMSNRRMRFKSPQRFVDELKHAISMYGLEKQYPVLAATFGVDWKNALDLSERIRDQIGEVEWVTEFRVDVKWEKYIDAMFRSGCKAFAVGIESASPDILRRMHKTSNPAHYVDCAERLIQKVSELGDTIMHINLMVYAGETPRTLRESMTFLMKWAEKIHSVHYSPLIAYPSTPFYRNFATHALETGASMVRGSPWDEMRIYPINPSHYFNYEEAGFHARMMEKLVMDEEKYMHMHETRFAIGQDGELSPEDKRKFMEQMVLASPLD